MYMHVFLLHLFYYSLLILAIKRLIGMGCIGKLYILVVELIKSVLWLHIYQRNYTSCAVENWLEFKSTIITA